MTGRAVLEVGSLNVNGSVREHVESMAPASYVGIDMLAGPGVDVVSSVEEWSTNGPYGLVLATEMLEHARSWRKALLALRRLTVVGGHLLLTTRSPGFPYHPGEPFAPFGDYWRFTRTHLWGAFSDWEVQDLREDPEEPGVFLLVKRPPTARNALPGALPPAHRV